MFKVSPLNPPDSFCNDCPILRLEELASTVHTIDGPGYGPGYRIMQQTLGGFTPSSTAGRSIGPLAACALENKDSGEIAPPQARPRLPRGQEPHSRGSLMITLGFRSFRKAKLGSLSPVPRNLTSPKASTRSRKIWRAMPSMLNRVITVLKSSQNWTSQSSNQGRKLNSYSRLVSATGFGLSLRNLTRKRLDVNCDPLRRPTC